VHIAHCDRQGHFRYVNRGYAERFGLKPEDLVGRTIASIIGTRAYATIEPHIRTVLSGRRASFETPIEYDRIGQRVMRCEYAPEIDDDGTVVGWVACVSDVTERARKDEDLRVANERFRIVSKATNDAIWDWDLATNSMWWNEGMTTLFGYAPGSIGPDLAWWHECVHPDDRGHVMASLDRAIRSRDPHWRSEYRFRRHDGTYRHVLDRGYTISDAQGKAARMIGSMSDVTEQKRAEDALRENDRRKDEFLAMLGHELRNPLAPIRTAVEILRRKGSPDPSLVRQRDVIARQVENLSRLVDDLLEVSRISRGTIRIQRGPTDSALVLARALESVRHQIDARHQVLAVAEPDHPIPLHVDATRLAQVLANLIQNASKYTATGGRIWVSVTAEEGHAVFLVRDSGQGIPPDMLEKVFEMFVQADRSIDRSQGGLGVGLTIVRRLVELHGGTVVAFSEGPGKGTAMTVRLPLSTEAPALTDQPAAIDAPRKLKVFVVDDNEDAATTLAEFLSECGHAVTVAHDGIAALERFQSVDPDVVLLDIGLPRCDGYETARRMRRLPRTRRLALVALTGYGQADDQRLAREAGFDEHVVKPCDPDRLLAVLDRAVGAR
jgi:two-component system CheB/CheR fusion protein